jgi:hypothetical protein
VPKFVLTIDTNSINTRQADENLNLLEEWHKKGMVEIVKTDVMDTEFMKASQRRRDLFTKKSSQYQEDMGEAYYGDSRYGHALYGPLKNYPLETVKQILFPNFNKLTEEGKERARRDAMHLATHYMYKRDFFITTDNHFLKNRDALKSKLSIVILRPDECVSRLRSEFTKFCFKK